MLATGRFTPYAWLSVPPMDRPIWDRVRARITQKYQGAHPNWWLRRWGKVVYTCRESGLGWGIVGRRRTPAFLVGAGIANTCSWASTPIPSMPKED